MKRIIYLLSLVILLPLSANAQGGFREEYERFKKQSLSTYSSFRDQCNKDFIESLKNMREYYEMGPAIQKPVEEEVPPVVIEEEHNQLPIEDNELPFDEVIPAPEVEPRPEPVEPIKQVPVIKDDWFEFSFFNTNLKVRANENNLFQLNSTSNEDIAGIWEKLAGKDYDNMLFDCLSIRENHKLCDWAYLLMLYTLSDSLLQSNNEATLLTAYLYSQSGYKMRLGVTGKDLCLLFGSKHFIYGSPYLEIDGDVFYVLNPPQEESDGFFVLGSSFPNEKELSLAIIEEPVFTVDASETRCLKSQKYEITASCSVNKNLLAFFDCYPSSILGDNHMTRWSFYANTPMDTRVKGVLYPSLRQAIMGQSTPVALNILLDFVQTSFEYEYDDKVWGRDRAFFAEESLYYPYCDCEDRSILFSRLVRDLLGLDVILVYYPGHLATAVKLDDDVKGDYIALNKDKYLVCDPTFIGANIGETMPDMDNKTAKVILLK